MTGAAGTGAPAGPPSSGTPATWISPTGPRPMAQPQAKGTSSASRPWMIGVIAVVVVVLLLGGLSAAGLFGPAQETPGPSNATGSADTATHAYPVVPGTKDEWVGPRPKSNKLAVAGGASSSVTNVSTLQVPDSGGQPVRASVATDLPGVFDFDPTWDPRRNVIAFARFQNGGSQIKYVVPGIGQRPDGVADQGISVKDPVLKAAAAGTRDHAPAWRGDGNLLFSRTRACRPGPGCVEDIVLATFSQRIGDYIVPIDDEPAVASDEWSEIRKIAVDPANDQQILVTGRNLQSPGQEFGVWVVDIGGDRALLPGSENATYAIVGTNDAVVAIERGNQDGWGPALLAWPRGSTGQPNRIAADDIIARMPGGSGSQVPIEFAGIASSPFGDDRYAVFAAERDADKSRTVPQIVILRGDGMPLGFFDAQPPQGVDWNTLIALGW